MVVCVLGSLNTAASHHLIHHRIYTLAYLSFIARTSYSVYGIVSANSPSLKSLLLQSSNSRVFVLCRFVSYSVFDFCCFCPVVTLCREPSHCRAQSLDFVCHSLSPRYLV